MAVAVLVGTDKGAAVLRSDDERANWTTEALQLPGWRVTAATRDASGRFYAAVGSEVYGAAIVVSDDLESWRQLDAAPRYEPTDRGNAGHHRLIRGTDFAGVYADQQRRYIDQIWKLFAAGDTLFAGVSEAGLFRSDDGGESWQPVLGINEHPSRPTWVPGAGGLGLHSILVDGEHPERMWVGISAAGVFRSDDGGETWERKNDGVAGDTIEPGDVGWEDVPVGVSKVEAFCVHGLTHDPHHADVIYRQDHHGMYITRDGGDSWELLEGGLPVVELSNGRRCVFGFAVALDTGSETVLSIPLAGDGFRYPIDGKLRVYRTHVGDESWEPTGEGLPDACFSNILRGAISLDSLDPCGAYFGTTGGDVFASRDAGQSWEALPVRLPRVLSVDAFAL
jgi:photosystem II stability/assembly factor-like uncharacterized protein